MKKFAKQMRKGTDAVSTEMLNLSAFDLTTVAFSALAQHRNAGRGSR